MRWEAEAIWEQVAPSLPGFSVEILPQVDSTNSELMRRGKAGQTDPILLVAEHQTAGRGRLGRVWLDAGTIAAQGPHSPAGPPQGELTPSGSVGTISTLMFSLGLPLAPVHWSGLSLAVGLGVAQSLHADVRLKWPNDLWLTQPGTGPVPDRKLGGILVETAAMGPGNTRWVVIGVGINIVPSDLQGLSTPPAWMQSLEPGVDAATLLLRLAGPMAAIVRQFEQSGFAPMQRRFNRLDALAGRPVQSSDGTEGIGQGVDEFGALCLATASGVVKITSSEVSVRPA
jgi:BirA family transcriptional regulator, biotin operon repressor / biotin---[acetyl-CoA-carboxylase] ligase